MPEDAGIAQRARVAMVDDALIGARAGRAKAHLHQRLVGPKAGKGSERTSNVFSGVTTAASMVSFIALPPLRAPRVFLAVTPRLRAQAQHGHALRLRGADGQRFAGLLRHDAFQRAGFFLRAPSINSTRPVPTTLS